MKITKEVGKVEDNKRGGGSDRVRSEKRVRVEKCECVSGYGGASRKRRM